ncbi:MAG TPA: ABATE domain-containing protein, partial [Actinomycetota bacterium]|nr:ABATE domain-containing protein [Actinomycetota bacterium]
MPDTNAARQGLDVVVRFHNTRDVERDQDDFTGPEPLRDWLVAEGLIGPSEQISRNDVARAVEFREALRALAFTNHGGPVDERTFGVLNRVTETAPLGIRFEPESARLLPRGTGIAGALA